MNLNVKNINFVYTIRTTVINFIKVLHYINKFCIIIIVAEKTQTALRCDKLAD